MSKNFDLILTKIFFVVVFCRRKWLPPPLRKLSQGKVDKTNAAASSALIKKGSETITAKTLPTVSAQPTASASAASGNDQEAEEETTFELPPPMKPIQEPQNSFNNGSAVSSSTAVDQSPCKRVRITIHHPPNILIELSRRHDKSKHTYCQFHCNHILIRGLWFWVLRKKINKIIE